MDDLTYDLMTIARRRNSGSYATQANRRTMLRAFAATLRDGGYELPSARSIKPRHVAYLLERWRTDKVSEHTMLNRVAVLRWWAESVDKASIIPRDNASLGLAKAAVAAKPRAHELEAPALAAIGCPRVRVSLELAQALGLRTEEAIKFTPGLALQADRPGQVQLKASWTKGGRPRIIPITNAYQREVLARAAAVAGTGSLIPRDKSYIQQLRTFKYQSLKAGIKNPHGLRHGYAQRRYTELTGWLPPVKGGTLPATPDALRSDRAARQEISFELGHARLAIVDTYLGRRVIA